MTQRTSTYGGCKTPAALADVDTQSNLFCTIQCLYLEGCYSKEYTSECPVNSQFHPKSQNKNAPKSNFPSIVSTQNTILYCTKIYNSLALQHINAFDIEAEIHNQDLRVLARADDAAVV